MKQFDQWMMPDNEQHLPGWMNTVNKRVDGRLTYQYGKYEMAKPFIKEFKTAIDVGSHIGLWAYFFAKDFDQVVCFEPMQTHVECWKENMKEFSNVELWEIALGANECFVELETRTANSSGDTQILNTAGNIPMKRLDDFGIHAVDLIKIDCEGYEEFILRGGRETLLFNKPCVIVEQKGDMSKKYGCQKLSAVHYLEELGATIKAEVSGDYILSWD